MIFNPQEKIFSLCKASTTYSNDLKTIWEEFFCFLVLAGLYREGQGVTGVHVTMRPINDENFCFGSNSYNTTLGDIITKGLRDRYCRLVRSTNLNKQERSVLDGLNHVFTPKAKTWLAQITGDQIFGICYGRQFSPAMQTVARYAACMFGQKKFPVPVEVYQLYLSKTGDLYLSKETVKLTAPAFSFGDRADGCEVTPLWALMFSMADDLASRGYPGDTLGERLGNYGFLTQPCEVDGSIPVPVYSNALSIKRLLGTDGYNRISVTASFYQNFLYGTLTKQPLSRGGLLNVLLDVMVKKTQCSQNDLFTHYSCYRQLSVSSVGQNHSQARPRSLQFALEALEKEEEESSDPTATDPDSKVKKEESPSDEPASTDTEVEGYDPNSDPSDAETDTGSDTDSDVSGYDPNTEPSEDTPVEAPVAQNTQTDTIGLLSFDKSGEGVDEDLYRSAVVALNDRLRKDPTLPVSAEAREQLHYWVSGFLYKTVITATKDLILALRLQSYFKKFNTQKEIG